MRGVSKFTRERVGSARRWKFGIRVAAPVVLAAAFVLFPFDWLADVWPAYGHAFDSVFTGPISHMIGHATLFFIAGALLLAMLPALRSRPVLYCGIMALAALAEEGIQGLARLRMPTLGDGRDLLLDTLGFCAAFAVALALAFAFPARGQMRSSS